jgi:hypothetical protein
MPYVMVPVPEEHVQDVMQFVIRTVAQASVQPWDTESMLSFFNEIDEPSRLLLSIVARYVRNGRELTERDAADLIELSAREVTGMQRELNERAQEAKHPAILFHRRVPEVMPNGRTREKRLIAMTDEAAKLFHDAENADLMGDDAGDAGAT